MSDNVKEKVIDVLIKASLDKQPEMTQDEKDKAARNLKAIYQERLK